MELSTPVQLLEVQLRIYHGAATAADADAINKLLLALTWHPGVYPDGSRFESCRACGNLRNKPHRPNCPAKAVL